MKDLFEHDDTPQPEGIGTHPLSVLHSLAPACKLFEEPTP